MKISFFISYLSKIIEAILQFTALFTFWDGVLFVILVFLVVYLLSRKRKYRVSSISINLPFSLGNITYEPTEQDRIVAWKLYVQLKTRKAALIFDENFDIIVDVYDSLYSLFPITRDLLTNLSLNEIEREAGIADLIFRVQNYGIRPHLTKWQSDFRRWWDKALKTPSNKDKKLQDIQKTFPKYEELIKELKEMNLELNKYAEDLLKIAKTPALLRKTPKEGKVKQPMPIAPAAERIALNRNRRKTFSNLCSLKQNSRLLWGWRARTHARPMLLF